MMETFFLCILIGVIALTFMMLVFLFKGNSVYDKLIGILVMSTKIILVLILIGFVDGRRDMYIDIAISYGILGFMGSVIIAKFLGQKGGRRSGN